MQTDELTSGYLNLLTQFKNRTRTNTDIVELEIMFWLEGYDLVIEEETSGCSMVLAIYSTQRKKWRYELLPGTPAKRMIEFFCTAYDVEYMPGELNKKFRFGL